MEKKPKKKRKGTLIRYNSLWTMLQVAVLVYFNQNKNIPANYRKIARAYGRSNYADYKKACDELFRKGYLDKTEKGWFYLRDSTLQLAKTGRETIGLPYFQKSLTELKERKKT